MPFPLNNVATTNDYSDANTAVISPPRSNVSLVITNAAIYYKIAVGSGLRATADVQYGPEVFAIPGRYFFEPSDFTPSGVVAALAIKSAVAGVPARVTIA